MPSLDDFVAKARDASETQFTSEFAHPFLLSEGASGQTGVWSQPNAPTQTTRRAVAQPLSTASSKQPVVIPLLRRDRSKHASLITVGRGEDCDLRLGHPLVSKRHAYFTQKEDGNWYLADAGSSNGTFADGTKLEPHVLRKLADSEVLRFGPEVRYRFFSSLAFYKYPGPSHQDEEVGLAHLARFLSKRRPNQPSQSVS